MKKGIWAKKEQWYKEASARQQPVKITYPDGREEIKTPEELAPTVQIGINSKGQLVSVDENQFKNAVKEYGMEAAKAILLGD